MSSKKEPEPFLSRVESSFQQLSVAANSLNTASDRLSRVVADLDAALKPLNVGLDCWVNMGTPWVSDDGMCSYTQQIGYAKIGGKWGIALRTVNEHYGRGDEDVSEWAFNEAPRPMRLKAIDYVPTLLQDLAREAERFTKSITEKTEQAVQLVSAVKGSVTQ